MNSKKETNLWLGQNPPKGFKRITENNLRGFKWPANIFYNEISQDTLLNMKSCPQYKFFKVVEE